MSSTRCSQWSGGRARRQSVVSPTLRLLAWGLLLSFGTETELRAYVDPGAGAMIWQMLVAGFLGALFYFRKFFPTTWLKKKNRPDEEN